MSELVAKSIALFLYAYVAAGALFAAVFVFIGVHRLDREAKDAGLGFRLIIFPGAVLLWPMLASRWARGLSEPPMPKDPHR